MPLLPRLFYSPRAIGALSGLLIGVAAYVPAWAGDIDEIQRRDLALIQTQVEQIQVVVDRIDARQQQTDPDTTRIYFDIPSLRSDLKKVSAGIDAYLDPARSLPRQPRPLEGDYLDDRGS